MKQKGVARLLLMAVLAVIAVGIAVFGVGEARYLSVANIKLGLDLSGGAYIVYQAEKEDVTPEEMDNAVSLIQRRLDRKGWSEGEASKEGDNRIRVEIPGIEDVETAVEELGATAQLSFVAEDGTVLLTGADVEDAQKQVGQVSQNGVSEPYVALRFTAEGREKFAQATAANVGKPIYIVMDDEAVSAPVVQAAITDGNASITGNFTPEEAEELAVHIREGSLPFALSVVDMKNVGARLGENSLETSLKAAVIGVALVLVFMCLAYRGAGFAADWALVFYMTLEVMVLSLFGVTLTLAGVAGIILSVGMAVDANVVIFERIKEEIIAGQSVRLAGQKGFSRALPAILDGNITTLIAALVLYFMGTGSVRGFAQTLMIGIVLSMFTAVFVTRFILKGFVDLGVDRPGFFAVKKEAMAEGGTKQ